MNNSAKRGWKIIFAPQRRKKTNLFIFGAVFITVLFFPARATYADYSAGTLVNLTNSARAQNGLGALSSNAQLTSAAYAKAQDMLDNDYFAHTSPAGKTPWDFILGSGYAYIFAGENLAIGYTDSDELFQAWMASATHRENILNSSFREIGMAVLSGEFEGAETIVVVQEFGAPQAQAVGQEVASEENSTPTETETTAENSQNSNSQANVEIIKDKSNFTPQVIFAGEEVTFKVTLSGKPKVLEISVFDKTYNLLETGTVEDANGQNTYTLKQKIDQEGKGEVVIKAQDENGKGVQENLGLLEAKKTVIAKNSAESENRLGFKDIVGPYWLIFVLGISGIGLVIAGYYVFRKYNLARLLPSWRF